MSKLTSEAGNWCSLVELFVAHSSSAVRSHVMDETSGLMAAVGLSSMIAILLPCGAVIIHKGGKCHGWKYERSLGPPGLLKGLILPL